MAPESPAIRDEVRTAEVIGALCLATDLGMGLPFEHGLQSTVFAMRLAESLGVDGETAAQVYYGCQLFYVGCTVDAEISFELFDDGVLLTHFDPVMFGSPTQTLAGIIRSLASSARTPPGKDFRVATTLPKAVIGHRHHITALCEVAQMLERAARHAARRRRSVRSLHRTVGGKGQPGELGRRFRFPRASFTWLATPRMHDSGEAEYAVRQYVKELVGGDTARRCCAPLVLRRVRRWHQLAMMASSRCRIAGKGTSLPGRSAAVIEMATPLRASCSKMSGSSSTPSAVKNVQCSIESTRVAKASAIPCGPCACAAILSP